MAIDKTMAIVKVKGGEDLFSKISSSIVGATKSGKAGSISATSEVPGGSGQLDQISAMEPDEIGGSLGRAEGLASALATSGLAVDKMADFTSMFVDFVCEKAGDAVAGQMLKKVAMIKGMMK